MGLCVFTYAKGGEAKDDIYAWSTSFIIWMFAIVIVGRTFAVWSVHYLFKACCKMDDVTVKELCFITWGGMIRGAIAFGLVLKIPTTKDD